MPSSRLTLSIVDRRFKPWAEPKTSGQPLTRGRSAGRWESKKNSPVPAQRQGNPYQRLLLRHARYELRTLTKFRLGGKFGGRGLHGATFRRQTEALSAPQLTQPTEAWVELSFPYRVEAARNTCLTCGASRQIINPEHQALGRDTHKVEIPFTGFVSTCAVSTLERQAAFASKAAPGAEQTKLANGRSYTSFIKARHLAGTADRRAR
jgi:hypothetical protein